MKPDVDDPLIRIITLFHSADDFFRVGRDYIGPHIIQATALRDRLVKMHGAKWWETLDVPPLWRDNPPAKGEEDTQPD